MNDQLLHNLHQFMAKASKATYASGGGKVDKPWRQGFKELEYREGDWYYRDSYTGFLRSWGQEVVWYKNKPVWTCLYGGGMEPDKMNVSFANETFGFLKKAFLAGDKENKFQHRNPSQGGTIRFPEERVVSYGRLVSGVTDLVRRILLS